MTLPLLRKCRASSLRQISKALAENGFLDVNARHQLVAPTAHAIDWLEHGEPRRTGRIAVRPGPLWVVSPRNRDIPMSLVVETDTSRETVPPLGPAHISSAISVYTEAKLCRRGYLRLLEDGERQPPHTLIGFAPTRESRTLAMAAAAKLSREKKYFIAIDSCGNVYFPNANGKINLSGNPGMTGISPWAFLESSEMVISCNENDVGLAARLLDIPFLTAHIDGLNAKEPIFRPAQDDIISYFYYKVIRDPIYIDPWSRAITSFEEIAEKFVWLRDRFFEQNKKVICVGFSKWKHKTMRRMFDGSAGEPIFVDSSRKAVARATAIGGRVVVWEARRPPDLEELCAHAGVALTRMEDGFIRSVGLGSTKTPGASFALDNAGIYFDPTRPSTLEALCRETIFSAELLVRAAQLRRKIVEAKLSKYNVGDGDLPEIPSNRTVVLVPGQVEDDKSIIAGSPTVRSNAELLKRARERHPDAFVIYKPHPDIEAGARCGHVDTNTTRMYADVIVERVPITILIDRVDIVETMTSLAGFEALLRGRRVTTHGQPFYAGWGLTEDLEPPPRRGRKLLVDELFAAAIILYPRYVDPITGLPCPAEIAIDRLLELRSAIRASKESAADRPKFPKMLYLLAHLLGLPQGMKQ